MDRRMAKRGPVEGRYLVGARYGVINRRPFFFTSYLDLLHDGRVTHLGTA